MTKQDNHAQSVSRGVDELILRLKEEGVREGQQQAEEIIEQAKKQASDILSKARIQAQETLEEAKKESKEFSRSRRIGAANVHEGPYPDSQNRPYQRFQ